MLRNAPTNPLLTQDPQSIYRPTNLSQKTYSQDLRRPRNLSQKLCLAHNRQEPKNIISPKILSNAATNTTPVVPTINTTPIDTAEITSPYRLESPKRKRVYRDSRPYGYHLLREHSSNRSFVGRRRGNFNYLIIVVEEGRKDIFRL